MQRKLLYSLLVLVLSLSLAAPAMAKDADRPLMQGNAKSYIVVMANDPIVSYEGEIPGYEATKPGKGQKVNPNSAHVRKYQSFLEKSHNDSLAAANVNANAKVHNYTFALNGYSAILTESQVEAIRAQKNVLLVLEDQMRFKQTDNTPGFLGLTAAGGAYANGYTGEGVVVGVIDSGIWPEHPSFADDGSYGPSPVPPLDETERSACDFGNTAHNPNDAAFTCNNKLLGARAYLDTYKLVFGDLTAGEYDSARDDDGHGTHTASTSAGNAGVAATIFGIPRGTISGIAPRARVIAYKGLGEQGGFNSDLAAAIDQAVADGVDVINYSIGGGASLGGADDIAFLFAADAGVFVANSAGNEGPNPGTIGGPASVPWLTSVGASSHSRMFISEITLTGPGTPPTGLWGSSVTTGITNFKLVDAQGIRDAAGDRSGRCLNPFHPNTFKANEAVLCNQYDFGVARTTRVANVKNAGGGAVIFHNSPAVSMMPTDNHPLPTVHMLNNVGQPLKNYLAANRGKVTISFTQSVAKYADSDPRVVPNVMASFSSRGPDPVALDIIKPDVTAPGISILAGASPIHVNTAAQGQLFQAIMGTSMSGPHVAGVFALLKQAHPEWSPAAAKSALMTTARQDVLKHDYSTPADPFDMGAGHIDPSSAGPGSPFDPGVIYEAGFLEYLGFLCDAFPDVFSNPEATCALLAASGIPTQAHNLNYPSIGVAEVPGTQTIQRTLTNVSGSALQLVPVMDAPDGYTVEVSPSELVIPTDQQASYTVTITNVSAPIGEWRFGSLTWVLANPNPPSKNYSAYSPIAVRAALFAAPPEIDGSGESGSASFDVTFGYSGSYTAAAHGLVPATVTSDNVLQDPDQTFDPSDVGAGGANVHQFTLSNVAFLRIAIPPEATEAEADLDVYVFNPNNQLVASSTLPATDELVNISQPADGTWSVYVHGWAAPGGDSDYTMYSWAISNTSGGNLTIVSAPASATSGATETINLSWTDATAGQWHLGAVSHTGSSGLMGLTLVNVDNR